MGGIAIRVNAIPGIAARPAAESLAAEATPPQAQPPAVAVKPVKPATVDPIALEQANIRASYQYSEELHQVIITLRREDTGEVIRQMPPEKVLRALESMMQLAGSMFDARG